ncbi:hypothetical protein HPB47_005221, partial [Ixodes persulcatus]
YLVTGEVEASQTLGRYHQPWAVTKKEGTVLSAHCTCMAGRLFSYSRSLCSCKLGEACSHVAALLFHVEVDVKFGMTDPSSTSVECRWITASSNAQAAPVAAIDFIKPSRKRQLKHAPTPKESSPVPEATAEQLQGFFKAVKEFAPSTLVLQSLTDSEVTDTAVSSDCGDDCDPVPTPGTVVNMECLYGSLDEPAGREATLTAAECNQVELCTRTQASSYEWFQQRRGRITASVVGKVRSCCTGAEGIVSEVMGYTKTPNVFSVRKGSPVTPRLTTFPKAYAASSGPPPGSENIGLLCGVPLVHPETLEAGGACQEWQRTLSGPANSEAAVQLLRRDKSDLLSPETRSLIHSPGDHAPANAIQSSKARSCRRRTPVDVRLQPALRPSLLQFPRRTRPCPSPASFSATAQKNPRLQDFPPFHV